MSKRDPLHEGLWLGALHENGGQGAAHLHGRVRGAVTWGGGEGEEWQKQPASRHAHVHEPVIHPPKQGGETNSPHRGVSSLLTMLAVMKQAKIMPCGMVSPLGLRAGVQRKTKVYMEASKRDCMAPSSAILVSAGGGGREGMQVG